MKYLYMLHQEDLLKKTLRDIDEKRKKFKKKAIRLQKIDDASSVGITTCNAVTVSSIVLTMSTANPATLIVSAVFSSISTLGTAVKSAYQLQRKVQTHKDAYLNLTILARDIRFFLTKAHENEDDYSCFITDVNNRLALIEDTVNLIETDSQERLINEH